MELSMPVSNPLRNISHVNRNRERDSDEEAENTEVTNDLLEQLLHEMKLSKGATVRAVAAIVTKLEQSRELQSTIIKLLNNQIDLISGGILPEMDTTTNLLESLVSNCSLTSRRDQSVMLTGEACVDDIHHLSGPAEGASEEG